MVLTQLSEKFDRVFIHRDSLPSPLAARVQAVMAREKITVVADKPMADLTGELSPAEFSRSKRWLYVAPYAGQFFKRCPGSRPGLACCNYFVLNLGLQCDMNCSYCYLQSFINTPLLTIYSNFDQALAELKTLHLSTGEQLVRVGTGETIDSLSLDPLTLYSRQLIAQFREFPKWTLEFKTKSAHVEQFLDEPHVGNVVCSWSINPQNVIEHEEHGTASLAERLHAAQACLARGFKLAFHIDPMIWHPDWRNSYRGLIDSVCERFTPLDVPYLSLGSLRFQPEQRAMMRERFGLKSYVTQAETFASADGKQRYDQSTRQEMFKFAMDEFSRRDPRWRVVLCMETPETWLKTAGQSPFRDARIKDLFGRDVVTAVGAAP